VPVTCFGPQSYQQLLLVLPVFGFLTLGMHAGYAIYFPELFPTHLRATGASFCFNGGRLAAAPIMVFSATLKGGKVPGLASIDLRWALVCLSSMFLIGIIFSPLRLTSGGMRMLARNRLHSKRRRSDRAHGPREGSTRVGFYQRTAAAGSIRYAHRGLRAPPPLRAWNSSCRPSNWE